MSEMSKRVLFAGTPDFALPSLQALVDAGYNVVGVLTQPDKEGARKKMTPPPTKVLAEKLGIPVLQFAKVRTEGVEAIRSLAPDVIVTAAYGQIISQEIIDIPPYGVINVHGSLLPKLRGACPIQQAIIDGHEETGITIMRTALKVDSGDMILQYKTKIGEKETAGELFDRMSVMGAFALIEALKKVFDGTAVYQPQVHEDATFCGMMKKENGRIDWSKTVWEIDCHVRGMNPWPSAFTAYQGKTLKIWQVEKLNDLVEAPCGSIVRASAKEGVAVQAKDGQLLVQQLQAEGGRRMSAKEYLAGHTLNVGEVLE